MTATPAQRRLSSPALGVICLTVVVVSQFVTVGADTLWLVAMGRRIASTGHIPQGVPFLAADTTGWVNVPVLGELAMAALDALGSWGLVTAQVAAVAVVLLVLTRDAARLGASGWGTAAGLFLFSAASLTSLGLVRAQLWSLPLFVLVVRVLRRDHERPSGWIWVVVPMLALWGNLHGAVLVGIAVSGAYLVFSRSTRPPGERVVLLIAVVATLWLTPAGLRSHEYYLGVLTSEAATRGGGMWASLSLDSTPDLLLIIAGVLLTVAFFSKRVPLWEWVVVGGLLVMTVQASRNGIWLLAFLMPRAALAIPRARTVVARSSSLWSTALRSGITILTVGLVIEGLAGQSAVVAAQRAEAQQLTTLIGQERVTLASSPLSESLAVQGVLLWGGNPLDALSQERQRGYLDFLSRGPQVLDQLAPRPDAVVLTRHTDQHPPATYVLLGHTARYSVYRRQPAS